MKGELRAKRYSSLKVFRAMKEARGLEAVEARQGDDVLHAAAQMRSENLGSYSRLEPVRGSGKVPLYYT